MPDASAPEAPTEPASEQGEAPAADELPEHTEGEVEPEGTANADEGA